MPAHAEPVALPAIDDKDIRRVACIMKLPAHAFSGKTGDDPRLEVIKTLESIDVSACPGSGKTTLLVAKMALLAEKWPHPTRGICVLSHTNAARNEIENKLSAEISGRKLLSYPHFIGTIHGFVNEFLALPWMRSRGISVKMIDTDLCRRKKWNALSRRAKTALELRWGKFSVPDIKHPDFSTGQIPKLGPETETFKEIQRVCRRIAGEGYFCYHEMFVWAEEMMKLFPDVICNIRRRFPLLMIDEAQDNSTEQDGLLHRIFIAGEGAVIRQRFGDSNQSIYDDNSDQQGVSVDPFPSASIKELPNSHRFGQDIAGLANHLGVLPYEGGMNGAGPQKKMGSGSAGCRHTIFLFDPGEKNFGEKVFKAYAILLADSFSEAELDEGVFTAVGHVHKPAKDDAGKFPHSIGQYWPGYDYKLAYSDPRPRHMSQYILVGQAKAEDSGEVYKCVGMISEGIMKLAGLMGGNIRHSPRQRHHPQILEALKDEDAKNAYVKLMLDYALMKKLLTREAWESHLRIDIKLISSYIAGQSSLVPEVDEFVDWTEGDLGLLESKEKNSDNIYRCRIGDREVKIRMGSIHSVKGETHTATLVLETYYRAHSLEAILPYICGNRPKSMNDATKARLKLHYVAMTRPTHLLCLAMKKSSVNEKIEEKLVRKGWTINRI